MQENWKVIKERNITEGSVYHDPDADTFIRYGSEAIEEEAVYQTHLYDLGFEVPKILKRGRDEHGWYFVEKSLGGYSLHDYAIRDYQVDGRVNDTTLALAADVSVSFLKRQLENSVEATPDMLGGWFANASHFVSNAKNYPQIKTEATWQALEKLFTRLSKVPMSYGHLDYGLPNTFTTGIIDWQYHSVAPVGFDAYTMLDAAAFMGATRGYAIESQQGRDYIAALDAAMEEIGAPKLSEFRRDFLVAKSLFFITTVRMDGSERQNRRCAYRRELFSRVIEQYNNDAEVDTSTFPTLAEFEQQYGR